MTTPISLKATPRPGALGPRIGLRQIVAITLVLSVVVLVGLRTDAARGASTYSLVWSTSADRSSPASLGGATTSGRVYVSVNTSSGATRAWFYLDDPAMAGAARLLDTAAPFDFAGSVSTSAAKPFDTTTIGDGSHTVTAKLRLSSGAIQVISATFTVANTSAPAGSPVSLFAGATPTVLAEQDPFAVELGFKFRTDVAGTARAIRFHKSTSNTGTHVASLWSSTGTLLGRATFTGESGSGWQQANLATPVSVSPGTTYVASYYTPTGYYSVDESYFASSRDNGVLHGLASGVDGLNGVYRYGPSGFPTDSYQASNYWVDVVFVPTGSGSPPPVTTTTTAPPVTTTTAPPATTTTTAPPTTTTTTRPPATTTTTRPPVTTTTTTAPPTTTTTTAPPSGGTRTCPAYPAMPDASCTGVPAGTALTAASGRIVLSTPGMIYENRDVAGCIVVQANNVTIRKVRVRGSSCDNQHQIDTGYGTYSGILVEDVEIDGASTSGFGAGIGNSGVTCRRCNIHHVGQGVNMSNDVTVVDSYIHDMISEGNPATSGSHNEAVISNGGSNFVIRHNYLDGETANSSSSISLYGDFGRIDNALVEQNLFNGGGYCVYGGSVPGKPYPLASNTRFLNNRFGQRYYATCGYYGSVTSYSSGSGNAWSGNVWDTSGAGVGAG